MRAGGISSHTDRSNIIPLIYVLPHANPSFFHVEVLGGIGGIVPDSHIITIPTGIARFNHGSCCCRSNWCTYRCGKVCPKMGLNTTVIRNATFSIVA